MRTIRDRIIKLCGGYTPKEYLRSEQKFQAWKDSKTNNDSVRIANEAIHMVLQDLEKYARSLYKDSKWADKMYYVLHNNALRLVARYLFSSSSVIYRIDTTLDSKDQFINILKKGNERDELEYLLDSVAETD